MFLNTTLKSFYPTTTTAVVFKFYVLNSMFYPIVCADA